MMPVSLPPTANKDGHWTDEEHELFLQSWAKYGKSWKKLAEIMKTRTNEQIRTHAQKYFNKLRELRSVCAVSPLVILPLPESPSPPLYH